MPVEYKSHLRGKAGRLDMRVRLVMQLAGLVLAEQIQVFAPLQYGHLTRGIKAGTPTIQGGRIIETLYSQQGYWKFLELPLYTKGRHLGPKSVAKGAKMPFIKPAFRAKKKELRKLIRDGFRAALKDISVPRTAR